MALKRKKQSGAATGKVPATKGGLKRKVVAAKSRDLPDKAPQKTSSAIVPVVGDEIPEKYRAEVRSVIAEIKKSENMIRVIGEKLLVIRFEQGCALKNIISSPQRYGKDVLGEIVRETGMSSQSLYEAHALAREFNYKQDTLDRQIKAWKLQNKQPTLFLARKELLRPETNADSVGGKDNQRDMLLGRAEAATSLLKAAMEANPNDPEVRGAAMEIVATLHEYQEWDRLQASREIERVELPTYKAFLKTPEGMICAFTGATENIESNHLLIGTKSQSQKPPDFWMVPMKKELHEEYHKSPKAFEREHGDVLPKIMATHFRYFTFIEELIEREGIKI